MEIFCDILLSLVHCVCGVYCLHADSFSNAIYICECFVYVWFCCYHCHEHFNPYPTAFPYGNGMVLHFYQQQESSTTKTVHKVINKGLKIYV